MCVRVRAVLFICDKPDPNRLFLTNNMVLMFNDFALKLGRSFCNCIPFFPLIMY